MKDESAPPSDPHRDVEPHAVGPKKKESPLSLVRAVDVGAEVRPLSPVRRYGPPLAVAAALALAAGASAYAMTRHSEVVTPIHASTPRYERTDDEKTDARSTAAVPPASEQPRLAGSTSSPTMPSAPPSNSIAATPPTAPSGSAGPGTLPSRPIVPHQPPPPMPGGMRPPSHDPLADKAI
jgi:hypothetical protein